MINAYKIWLEILKGRNLSEDLGIDGRILLKCILRKYAQGGVGQIGKTEETTRRT
jgi:hypothetical protein